MLRRAVLGYAMCLALLGQPQASSISSSSSSSSPYASSSPSSSWPPARPPACSASMPPAPSQSHRMPRMELAGVPTPSCRIVWALSRAASCAAAAPAGAGWRQGSASANSQHDCSRQGWRRPAQHSVEAKQPAESHAAPAASCLLLLTPVCAPLLGNLLHFVVCKCSAGKGETGWNEASGRGRACCVLRVTGLHLALR